ncbi:hypothetical protein O181_051910 [Austropuccinia psidii MF-1]|uniref:Chromo domain-containing protein n=1 Tax=Austropuccinia psidii MF-1 TaxID=1389203 RepID=A0A9Q3E3X2_9BASI|nr:hypothetical protein [Austropuccinia psidii MF-1]
MLDQSKMRKQRKQARKVPNVAKCARQKEQQKWLKVELPENVHGMRSAVHAHCLFLLKPFQQEFPLLRSGRQHCDNKPVTNVMGSIPVGDKRRSQSNNQKSLGFPLHWCTRVAPLVGSLKHPVFPVSLVKPYFQTEEDKFPSRRRNPTPSEIVEVEDSPGPVSKIIRARKIRPNGKDQRQYLVRLKHQTADKDKWLAEDAIPDGNLHLRRFRGSRRTEKAHQ